MSFDRANLWDDNPGTLPRDFTLAQEVPRVVAFELLDRKDVPVEVTNGR